MSCFTKNSNCFIIPSTTINNIIINENFKYLVEFDLIQFDSLIAALLVNSNHWNLFYVSLKNKTISLIDPFGAKNSFVGKALVNWT